MAECRVGRVSCVSQKGNGECWEQRESDKQGEGASATSKLMGGSENSQASPAAARRPVT